MHTAITIGKIKFLATLLGCFVFASTYAETITAERFTDFENYPLGKFPSDIFNCGWGSRTNGKQIYVTNVNGFKSDKSLAIRLEPKAGMFGFGSSIHMDSDKPTGIITVEFDFRKETNFDFGAELRGADGKLWPWNVSRTVSIHAPRGQRGSVAVGNALKNFKWYHLTYTLPLTKEDAPAETVTLKDWETGESWTASRNDERLGGNAWFPSRPETHLQFFINMNPQHSSDVGLLYIDNYKVSIK